jgi:hypothetical protein
MAVTHGKIVPRAVRTLSGSPIPKHSVPEKATRTFKKGAVVFVNAGFLDECGANPTLIFGVCTQDGSNSASDGTVNNQVELAHPDVLYRGYVDSNDSGTFNSGANTDLMKGYGISRSATAPNQWFVDTNKTGNNVRVVIWEFWSEVNYTYVGDTLPHVVFGFTFHSDQGTQNVNFQGSLGS